MIRHTRSAEQRYIKRVQARLMRGTNPKTLHHELPRMFYERTSKFLTLEDFQAAIFAAKTLAEGIDLTAQLLINESNPTDTRRLTPIRRARILKILRATAKNLATELVQDEDTEAQPEAMLQLDTKDPLQLGLSWIMIHQQKIINAEVLRMVGNKPQKTSAAPTQEPIPEPPGPEPERRTIHELTQGEPWVRCKGHGFFAPIIN